MSQMPHSTIQPRRPRTTIVLEPARRRRIHPPRPDVLVFLRDRLAEEVDAARHRQGDGASDVPERGLDLMRGLIADIDEGRGLTPCDVQLLTRVYRDDPRMRDVDA